MWKRRWVAAGRLNEETGDGHSSSRDALVGELGGAPTEDAGSGWWAVEVTRNAGTTVAGLSSQRAKCPPSIKGGMALAEPSALVPATKGETWVVANGNVDRRVENGTAHTGQSAGKDKGKHALSRLYTFSSVPVAPHASWLCCDSHAPFSKWGPAHDGVSGNVRLMMSRPDSWRTTGYSAMATWLREIARP
ncbi:hypothetical protein N657DRAFT_716885 [Parathielavia appendiculata]|uniref:Uncharacterized protein n=1 Tax=Parathielavia appendiculata TaxID=2587402 RepID=A0AAN6TZN1_9PEZI|nr:hypothetical protein N657DRAFT_716885 [Parathielavia appendiculata]